MNLLSWLCLIVKACYCAELQLLALSVAVVLSFANRVKWLQTQLTEKEAMVKVYQRAPPSLPRSSSVHAICCSPHHSPRPSLIASTAYTRPSGPVSSSSVATGSYCDFVSIRHVKTGGLHTPCTRRLWGEGGVSINVLLYLGGRNSSFVVCWVCCSAWCSVVGSIVLWGEFFW